MGDLKKKKKAWPVHWPLCIRAFGTGLHTKQCSSSLLRRKRPQVDELGHGTSAKGQLSSCAALWPERENRSFTPWSSHPCDHPEHFSNWCSIYKVVKVVHGNWSDNQCNWSDTQPSILILELYKQTSCSLPYLEHTHTHTRTRTHTHTHTYTLS